MSDTAAPQAPAQVVQVLVSTTTTAVVKPHIKRIVCTCPNCTDGIRHSDKKRRHICHITGCNKEYLLPTQLRTHLRWHAGDKPFACRWLDCDKSFVSADGLQRHRRTHTGGKRFKCPKCNMRFMRSDHLNRHIPTHSKQKGTNSEKKNIKVEAQDGLSDESSSLTETETNRLIANYR